MICLIFSLPEKLKNSIFEMPIISQTLNTNNSRTTRAKSITLHTIRKQCLLLPFSRYWCPKVDQYYHSLSGVEWAKGLKHNELNYSTESGRKQHFGVIYFCESWVLLSFSDIHFRKYTLVKRNSAGIFSN